MMSLEEVAFPPERPSCDVRRIQESRHPGRGRGPISSCTTSTSWRSSRWKSFTISRVANGGACSAAEGYSSLDGQWRGDFEDDKGPARPGSSAASRRLSERVKTASLRLRERAAIAVNADGRLRVKPRRGRRRLPGLFFCCLFLAHEGGFGGKPPTPLPPAQTTAIRPARRTTATPAAR